jgi:ELWxxDGT repeat protein
MPVKPRHHLRPLSSLLLSAALGCSGPAPEQQPAQAPVSKASRLSTPGLPPGLAPSLMKDIQVGTDTQRSHWDTGSLLEYTVPISVTLGSTLYFTALEESTGQEFWRTDGTPEETRLVRELIPGYHQEGLTGLATVGGALFISTSSFSSDGALWKSDGTAQGTVRFDTQGRWWNPSQLATCNGALFFQDHDPTYSLWKSDGTAEGTVLLSRRDILKYEPYLDPPRSLCVNGTLFFVARGPGREELWKSDGTAQGTVLLADLGDLQLPWDGTPFMFAVGSHLVVDAYEEGFWMSDGTPEGTRKAGGMSTEDSLFLYPQLLTPLGETLYFAALDQEYRYELWASDGTVAGLRKVTRLPEGSWISGLVSLGDTLLYTTSNGVFRSNGTPEGTVLLDNRSLLLVWGESARLPDGRWLIVNKEGTGTFSLWVTDGTSAGTTPLPPAQGQTFTRLLGLKRHGDVVLFWADDGLHGMEPWVTDGTPAGTRLLHDIYRADSSNPRELLDLGGTLLFTAQDAEHGRELWKSDGTAEGTVLVADLGATGSEGPSMLTRVGEQVFFFSQDQLWKTDGTSAGTQRVAAGSSLVSTTGTLGTAFFFSPSNRTHGSELWTSDGTAGGTFLLRDIHPGPGHANPWNLTQVGSTLFFSAHDGVHGDELWKTDGTPGGTVLVKDLRPGLPGSGLYGFVRVGSTLFFSANDGVHGYELWKSDGTAEGTVLVADLHPRANSFPRGLVAREGVVFFLADDGVHGDELWKSDGTAGGTRLVADIVPGPGTAFPPYYSYSLTAPAGPLHVIDGALYFTADDGVHGAELWKSDGTAAGTRLFRDLTPGAAGSALWDAPLVPVGQHGTFAFPAPDAAGGVELWMSDGTTGGTRPLHDLAPGGRGSTPARLTVSGSRLFFVADEGEHGRELWSVKQAAFHRQP